MSTLPQSMKPFSLCREAYLVPLESVVVLAKYTPDSSTVPGVLMTVWVLFHLVAVIGLSLHSLSMICNTRHGVELPCSSTAMESKPLYYAAHQEELLARVWSCDGEGECLFWTQIKLAARSVLGSSRSPVPSLLAGKQRQGLRHSVPASGGGQGSAGAGQHQVPLCTQTPTRPIHDFNKPVSRSL